MQISKSSLKRIRKYSRLRSGDEPALKYKILKRVYIEATNDNRKRYDTEMNDYFKAIDGKKIEKGQSILHVLAN